MLKPATRNYLPQPNFIRYDGAFAVTPFLIAAFGQTVFKLLLGGTAIFLILLVLVQRGRGGGLAGALGGMGGSSAFGAKAGDVFTKITIGAATFWILLCIAATKLISTGDTLIDIEGKGPAKSAIQALATDDSEENSGSAADTRADEEATVSPSTESDSTEATTDSGENAAASDEP